MTMEKMQKPNLNFLFAILLAISMVATSSAQLQVGFYQSTCPTAESIVTSVVKQANAGTQAGLVRLHFHDCFVRGCDGSVLIASTASNPSERASPINLSLRPQAFAVIDQAKTQLEAACPGIVSCADIVALAARDSAAALGLGITYPVQTGRRDGTVSLASEPLQNVPQFNFTLAQLESTFAGKGLSVTDMVVLSGAHSVGLAHCSSFTNRLYPTVDPTLDPTFASRLLSVCPSADTSSNNPTTSLDVLTPNTLDNKYFVDLLQKRVVMTSDQDLSGSATTLALATTYAAANAAWARLFGASMQKMGKIGVLTGTQGEIRKVCSAFN
ncbi:hypothetical protein Dimus_035748 [Dionaea muscipula]